MLQPTMRALHKRDSETSGRKTTRSVWVRCLEGQSLPLLAIVSGRDCIIYCTVCSLGLGRSISMGGVGSSLS